MPKPTKRVLCIIGFLDKSRSILTQLNSHSFPNTTTVDSQRHVGHAPLQRFFLQRMNTSYQLTLTQNINYPELTSAHNRISPFFKHVDSRSDTNRVSCMRFTTSLVTGSRNVNSQSLDNELHLAHVIVQTQSPHLDISSFTMFTTHFLWAPGFYMRHGG